MLAALRVYDIWQACKPGRSFRNVKRCKASTRGRWFYKQSLIVSLQTFISVQYIGYILHRNISTHEFLLSTLHTMTSHRWLSARLQCPHCYRAGYSPVLHWAIDISVIASQTSNNLTVHSNQTRRKRSIKAPKNRPGVGVTKPLSSVPLFSGFLSIVKPHVSYWISRLYLAGVAAALLRWHLSNMDVIRRILHVLLPGRKFCLRMN